MSISSRPGAAAPVAAGRRREGRRRSRSAQQGLYRSACAASLQREAAQPCLLLQLCPAAHGRCAQCNMAVPKCRSRRHMQRKLEAHCIALAPPTRAAPSCSAESRFHLFALCSLLSARPLATGAAKNVTQLHAPLPRLRCEFVGSHPLFAPPLLIPSHPAKISVAPYSIFDTTQVWMVATTLCRQNKRVSKHYVNATTR